jgi:hypothetical protein
MSAAGAMLKHLSDLKHLPLHGLRFRLVDAEGQVSPDERLVVLAASTLSRSSHRPSHRRRSWAT